MFSFGKLRAKVISYSKLASLNYLILSLNLNICWNVLSDARDTTCECRESFVSCLSIVYLQYVCGSRGYELFWTRIFWVLPSRVSKEFESKHYSQQSHILNRILIHHTNLDMKGTKRVKQQRCCFCRPVREGRLPKRYNFKDQRLWECYVKYLKNSLLLFKTRWLPASNDLAAKFQNDDRETREEIVRNSESGSAWISRIMKLLWCEMWVPSDKVFLSVWCHYI